MSAPEPVDECAEALAVAKLVVAGADDIRVPQDLLSEPNAPPSAAASEKAIWLRIRVMTVGQKVKLAFNGNKDARTVLLRDTNKIIPRLVLHNPAHHRGRNPDARQGPQRRRRDPPPHRGNA